MPFPSWDQKIQGARLNLNNLEILNIFDTTSFLPCQQISMIQLILLLIFSAKSKPLFSVNQVRCKICGMHSSKSFLSKLLKLTQLQNFDTSKAFFYRSELSSNIDDDDFLKKQLWKQFELPLLKAKSFPVMNASQFYGKKGLRYLGEASVFIVV